MITTTVTGLAIINTTPTTLTDTFNITSLYRRPRQDQESLQLRTPPTRCIITTTQRRP